MGRGEEPHEVVVLARWYRLGINPWNKTQFKF